VNVTDKAVILLRHEPRRATVGGTTRTLIGSGHSILRRKIANAYEHGASAVILCTDHPQPREDTLVPFGAAGYRCSHPGMPVLHCRRATLEPAIRAAYGTDLAAVEAQINLGPKPKSRELAGWRIAGSTDIERIESTAKNIAALLPGDGPSADETIVIGAHYDHFGFTETETAGKKTRAIYSGADDNASGVSAILETARYLARRPHHGRRQVLFLAFSAEERGMVGSAYYVSHPLIPLNKTVAMLNLDMVGRLRDNKLYVRGVNTASDWRGLLEGLNSRHRFALELQDRFGSSDQLSFYAKEIPILAFFTGRHEDYHETTDKFDKLNLPGMRRTTQLVEDVLVALTDVPARPAYIASVPPDEREPYFGVFGDFTRSDLGYALGPVAKGGPAERAGLHDGDVLVQFDSNRIATADDFTEALSHYAGGERVKVVVKRGNQSRAFDVTLGRPGEAAKGRVAN
jgi:hypothetical protein